MGRCPVYYVYIMCTLRVYSSILQYIIVYYIAGILWVGSSILYYIIVHYGYIMVFGALGQGGSSHFSSSSSHGDFDCRAWVFLFQSEDGG